MTINTLSAKTGVSGPTIHSIFNKNEANTKHLEKIADVFGVQVAYFFSEENFKTQVNSTTSQAEDVTALRLENSRLLKEISELKTKIIQLLEKKG